MSKYPVRQERLIDAVEMERLLNECNKPLTRDKRPSKPPNTKARKRSSQKSDYAKAGASNTPSVDPAGPPWQHITVEEAEDVNKRHDCNWCERWAGSHYVISRVSRTTEYRYTDHACARCALEWWEAAESASGKHPAENWPRPLTAGGVEGVYPAPTPGTVGAMTGEKKLEDSLPLAVVLRMQEIEAAGGPTESDHRRVDGYKFGNYTGDRMAGFGDNVFLPGYRADDTAEEFGGLVDALAVVALTAPGRVKFAGHWFGRD